MIVRQVFFSERLENSGGIRICCPVASFNEASARLPSILICLVRNVLIAYRHLREKIAVLCLIVLTGEKLL